MASYIYPPSPAGVDMKLLAPSASFKKQVGRVMGSIILFFVVYLLLVIAALGLAVACFYIGAMLIVHLPRIYTILIGLGMMALGLSVVFFLIKFIFSVSKNENASRVEIKEQDQPQLFDFIRTLSKETRTPFPKKIFITSDVNASVSYNSSFWSMFFPVRKNLDIGLGLVNSLNISEFKAVVAHEFGHFSQRSMKLGSFTYNVNQVIYNMLYNNTGYTAFLNSWGSVSSTLAFFAGITVKIAVGIQWVLRQMYGVINKSYYSLSREMEFHADAVSASVSGGNNLISALTRIELAASCYNSALNNAGDWLKEKKATANIFSNQLTILQSWAKEFQLPLKGGLPEVSYHFMQSFSQSRINYKNQWASHPTLEERKSHLDKAGVYVDADDTTAWQVFDNISNLQQQLTDNLYKNAKAEEALEKFDGAYFEEWYNKKRESAILPQEYKGFYNKRFINTKDWNFDSLVTEQSSVTFDELYNDENGQLQSLIDNNTNDIETVQAIKNKQIDVKSFDFDGDKYEIADCDKIIEQLENENKDLLKKQEAQDRASFVYFYSRANGSANLLRDNYTYYTILYKDYEDYSAIVNSIFETINPFYRGGLTLEDIKQSVQGLKAIHEKKLKTFYKKLLDDKVINSDSNKLADRIATFINNDYAYFVPDKFNNEELSELHELIVTVAEELTQRKLRWYKKMLEEQLQYI